MHNLFSENMTLVRIRSQYFEQSHTNDPFDSQRHEINHLTNLLTAQRQDNPLHPMPEDVFLPVKPLMTPDLSPNQPLLNETPQVPRENVPTEPMTIAMKLKLSQATPDPVPVQEMAKVNHSEAAKTQVTSQNRLFVGHLSPASTEKSVKKYFMKFGDVVDVYFPPDKAGLHRGYCFVTFTKIFDMHPLDKVGHQIDGQ